MEQYGSVQQLLDSMVEAKSRIARLSRRVELLKTKCGALTAKLTVKTGGGRDDMEDTWCQLAEERERLAQQLRLLLALERQVEQRIDRLPKDRWRMVLRYRYLDGMTFPCIAFQLKADAGLECTDGRLHQIHRQAMEELERQWENEIPEP